MNALSNKIYQTNILIFITRRKKCIVVFGFLIALGFTSDIDISSIW